MARCPFAIWKPISGSSGAYVGGPFKIVHHTTEGSTASGAIGAYRSNRSDPHFTVDRTTIYQHIDTGVAARALKNLSGGVQTNKDSAVQIEVVGFAGRSKDRSTLNKVARLCRWIETIHGIPKVWPNGFPKNGSTDPGGHNRNKINWDTKGGHYGHSQIPENDHWDPGYTSSEIDIIMGVSLESVEVEAESTDSLSLEDESPTLDRAIVTNLVIPVSLDLRGQGSTILDIAWERIIGAIPKSVRQEDGTWTTCNVSLAEIDGQTLLIANSNAGETIANVLVKVLEDSNSSEESLGCP
jgi:hypothetical protein